ncbi:DUF2283 domain-containing protein [Candidatus Berkelbacteria bacterium]|nr:DUF2283 domain-containing protein [Candidatus Berkelbacteria bacterium]
MSKKIIYDKAGEVLSVEISNEKSVDSDIRDNVVLDYNKKGEVVRINLYNFSFDAFRENVQTLKKFARHARIPLAVR